MEFLGLRKGAWTHEEDLLLRKCVEELGEGKWRQIPVRAGLNRCRKSCRLRWLNYLRPNLRRGEFDKDEVDLILRLHKLLGNKWSLIAGRLPSRTTNDIKNYWNSRLGKKLLVKGDRDKKLDAKSQIVNNNNNVMRPQPDKDNKPEAKSQVVNYNNNVIRPQPWNLQRNQWRLHQFDGHYGLRLGEGLINRTTMQDTSMDDQMQWPWKDFLLDAGEEEKCFSSTKSVSGEDQTTKISSRGDGGGGEYGMVGGGGGVEREEDMFLEDLFKLVGEEWEIL